MKFENEGRPSLEHATQSRRALYRWKRKISHKAALPAGHPGWHSPGPLSRQSSTSTKRVHGASLLSGPAAAVEAAVSPESSAGAGEGKTSWNLLGCRLACRTFFLTADAGLDRLFCSLLSSCPAPCEHQSTLKHFTAMRSAFCCSRLTHIHINHLAGHAAFWDNLAGSSIRKQRTASITSEVGGLEVYSVDSVCSMPRSYGGLFLCRPCEPQGERATEFLKSFPVF